MITYDYTEAQQRLPQLLAQAHQGEEIHITYNGYDVRLAPATQKPEIAETTESEKAMAELLTERAHRSLGGLSWKDLRDEGRRW